MKQIETYVNQLYKKTGGDPKEKEELKMEMIAHLTEAAEELKREGKTEKEAIRIAIHQFGGESDMRNVVKQLFQAQQVFARWVLYLACSVLVLGVLSVFFFHWHWEQIANRQSEAATEVFRILEGKEAIDSEMKEAVKAVLQTTNHIERIEIFNVKDIKEGSARYASVFDYVKEVTPTYSVSQSIFAPTMVSRIDDYGNGNDTWYVNMKSRSFADAEGIIAFASLAVYWVLFAIYATVNAYRRGRLNGIWVVVFASLNVIGYMMFLMMHKKKTNN